MGYFYPRSPCGERRATKGALPLWSGISIHALLAESDWAVPVRNSRLKYFYPRSPCGERQYDPELYTPYALISIHALLAESDTMHHLRCPRSRDFYPRSPCGERPIFAVRPYDAPIFLSTLSLRRATSGVGRL